MKITRADKVLIAFLFLLNVALFVQMDFSSEAGDWVVIEVDQKEVKRLSLSKEQTATVEGRLGESKIEIKDGKARFVKSPCGNKICIKSGYIQYADRLAACIPNRVVIRIQGESQRGVDAVVG